MFNALSLWLIAAWIFFEAYRRFHDVPEQDFGIDHITIQMEQSLNAITSTI